MGCLACFDGGSKQRRREEERLASEEARAKAAEAAQKRCRIDDNGPIQCEAMSYSQAIVKGIRPGMEKITKQEQFEQSAAGRAAKAQLAAAAKQKANTNQGEPVLKWQMG